MTLTQRVGRRLRLVLLAGVVVVAIFLIYVSTLTSST